MIPKAVPSSDKGEADQRPERNRDDENGNGKADQRVIPGQGQQIE